MKLKAGIRVKKAGRGKPVDAAIIELGGTVGDIEGLPFLEAIRQLVLEAGIANCLNIHITLVPYVRSAGEVKTKPTQHSVAKLREIGIVPEILMCRTERSLSREVKRKIALFCNVEENSVIEAIDVDSIYEIPIKFQEQRLDSMILKRLDIKSRARDLARWKRNLKKYKNARRTVRISVVGKYTKLQDSYKSIQEALTHAGIAADVRVQIDWVESELLERGRPAVLKKADGILIPGGFGTRGSEGKILAAGYARKNNIPFFGICAGLQCAVIEFARNECGLRGANSAEFDPRTKYPVISLLPEQEKIRKKGATMRLGSHPCEVRRGSLAWKVYKSGKILERHRHRYEVNKRFLEKFERDGMVFSGIFRDEELIDIIEIPGHRWFIACQFHPEFKSKFGTPHPLFESFVRAAAGGLS